MKKTVSVILLLGLIFSLCACGGNESDAFFKYYEYPDMSKYITVKKYKGIEYSENIPEVAQKIKKKYQTDLESLKLYKETELTGVNTVIESDTVVIDYVGKIDGKEFEGGSAENADLEIGSNSFIEGFETGLIGKKTGETVKLNLKFPTSYHSKDLAGKGVEFTVTIKKIKRKTFNELDEVFASEMGYKSLDEYKKAIADGIKSDYIWITKAVGEASILKYPEKELNNNIEYLSTQYATYKTSYFSNYEEGFNNLMREYAEERTKEEMVAYYIAKKENISVDIKDAEKEAESTYGKGKYTQKQLSDVQNTLLVKKVMEFVVKNASVK